MDFAAEILSRSCSRIIFRGMHLHGSDLEVLKPLYLSFKDSKKLLQIDFRLTDWGFVLDAQLVKNKNQYPTLNIQGQKLPSAMILFTEEPFKIIKVQLFQAVPKDINKEDEPTIAYRNRTEETYDMVMFHSSDGRKFLISQSWVIEMATISFSDKLIEYQLAASEFGDDWEIKLSRTFQ